VAFLGDMEPCRLRAAAYTGYAAAYTGYHTKFAKGSA
jgi:hypothetical protein